MKIHWYEYIMQAAAIVFIGLLFTQFGIEFTHPAMKFLYKACIACSLLYAIMENIFEKKSMENHLLSNTLPIIIASFSGYLSSLIK